MDKGNLQKEARTAAGPRRSGSGDQARRSGRIEGVVEVDAGRRTVEPGSDQGVHGRHEAYGMDGRRERELGFAPSAMVVVTQGLVLGITRRGCRGIRRAVIMAGLFMIVVVRHQIYVDIGGRREIARMLDTVLHGQDAVDLHHDHDDRSQTNPELSQRVLHRASCSGHMRLARGLQHHMVFG